MLEGFEHYRLDISVSILGGEAERRVAVPVGDRWRRHALLKMGDRDNILKTMVARRVLQVAACVPPNIHVPHTFTRTFSNTFFGVP